MIKRFIISKTFCFLVLTLAFFMLATHFCNVKTMQDNKKTTTAAETKNIAAVEPAREQQTEQPEKQYNIVTVTATAYCPCSLCCGKCDGITATGTQATAGRTIAADPSIYPYGTRLLIDENIYVVEDCGGAVKGNQIDIFFNTHAEALQFGRRTLTAKVLN